MPDEPKRITCSFLKAEAGKLLGFLQNSSEANRVRLCLYWNTSYTNEKDLYKYQFRGERHVLGKKQGSFFLRQCQFAEYHQLDPESVIHHLAGGRGRIMHWNLKMEEAGDISLIL